jgi:hypothetical protein
LPRVRGQFPKASSRQVISLADVEACIGIEPRTKKRSRLANFGCYIAGFGDDESVYVGVLNGVLKLLEFHAKQSTMETAGQISAPIKETKKEGFFGSLALHDARLGGGVTDRLVEEGHEVLPLNFGSAVFRDDEFADLRSDVVVHASALRRPRDLDPDDAKLIATL